MLVTIDQAKKMIEANEILLIAGDENSVEKLPNGRWIGGTIPYFMNVDGGISTKEKVFVNNISEYVNDVKIDFYNEENLKNIAKDAPENGFTIIIIPATSKVHISYAENVANYDQIFMKPIIGWISGVHLDDLGKITPKVFNGVTGEKSENKTVVLHASLASDKWAVIGIINIFRQGKGDSIQFETNGFSIKECLINGDKTNFADYIVKNKIDTKLPLVANYSGSMVNVSIQAVDEKNKIVNLYAPVFKNVEYKFAFPVKNYVKEFMKQMPGEKITPIFSCNCILNYLYSELEGKKRSNITGPMTFGEIAYQLLNQTLTYLEIKDV